MITIPKSKLKQLIREAYIETFSDKEAKKINEVSFLRKIFGTSPKSEENRPFRSSNWSPEFMAAHRERFPDFPEGRNALPNAIHDNGWKGLLMSMTPEEQNEFMALGPAEQERVANKKGYNAKRISGKNRPPTPDYEKLYDDNN
jgi:hypothetical protein